MFAIKHRFLIIFALIVLVFLVVSNRWFWPTPDEYLYASVARSIIAGVKGEICLSCFNTEHTYLVSSLVALYQWFFNISNFDLVSARLPVIFFSLGTVWVLWLIAAQVVIKPQEKSWFLWILLLIPGYFALSTHLLLDIPLTFGFALLIYLMIRKAKTLWIGLALALILLVKDYGLYLAGPLVSLSILFDAINLPKKRPLQKLLFFLSNFLVVFLPSVLFIIFILAFDILPYPRLLEAGLIQYFGDLYYAFAKLILTLLDKSITTIKTVAPALPPVNINFNNPTNVILPGEFPTSIFQSPVIPETTGGFFHKLWLIYKYNFSEQDVMVFTLPLFLTGLVNRIKTIWTVKNRWLNYRADIIMLIFAAIFAFVNWHEALNLHGFRLTAPMTVALIYFSYFGVRSLLLEKNAKSQFLFSILFFISLFLFVKFVGQISSYGSIISDNDLISFLLNNKIYIFTVIFTIVFIYLIWYPRINFRFKSHILMAGILALFFLKFLPFYLESKAALKLYEFDYGLPKASVLSDQFNLSSTRIAMNVNQYVMRYYFGQLKLSTTDNHPQMRIFKEEYPEYYSWFRSPDEFDSNFIIEYEPRFIFFLNKNKGNNEIEQFEKVLEPYQNYVRLIKEEKSPSGHLQWRFYAFDRDGFFRDVVRLGD